MSFGRLSLLPTVLNMKFYKSEGPTEQKMLCSLPTLEN